MKRRWLKALPKKISLTDPQSRWTAAPGGPAYFAYSTNYLIDTEHGVIMGMEAPPVHRTAEVDSTICLSLLALIDHLAFKRSPLG